MDDTLVAILSDHDGSTYQFVETDQLGTPRAVIHPTKNTIVWRWDLNNTTFGEHAPSTDPDANGINYTLNLRFPGQVFDPVSGMDYNYRRDFDPSVGRYLESDPTGQAGGVSTYGYVNGTPLTSFDPNGLFDVRARYSCTPLGGCGYTYRFSFQTSCVGAYAGRFKGAVAGFAISRVGGLPAAAYTELSRGEKVIAHFDAKPTGSSEVPSFERKGVCLCARADGDFKRILEEKFPGQLDAEFSPEDAQSILDAFEQNLFKKERACGYFDNACRDPYRRLLSFYDFENLLLAANLNVDIISQTKVDK
jgi:RHS repeat-associated protein